MRELGPEYHHPPVRTTKIGRLLEHVGILPNQPVTWAEHHLNVQLAERREDEALKRIEQGECSVEVIRALADAIGEKHLVFTELFTP